jgi:replicative DNA helicase
VSSTVVPHNLDAERAVLGAVLRVPEQVGQLLDVEPNDFWHAQHRNCCRAIQEAHRAGDPVDPVTLELRGIPLELTTELAGAVGTASNLNWYVRQVQDCATKRRLMALADSIGRKARGEDPVEEVLAGAIAELQTCYRGKSTFRHLSEFATEWYESARRRSVTPDEAAPLGVPTGITRLNDLLTFKGLPRGHLTVVGAESSQGKSALLDNGFALPAALAGCSVCLCSFEDDGRSVFVRGLSSRTGIQNRQLQQEMVGMLEWHDVMGATEEISGLDVWVLDVVPSSVDQMVGQIRRHLAEHPADLLGIDYLQFIRAGVQTEGKTAASEYVITAIAVLARELRHTATVLLSQYRKLKDRGARPMDDDLRDAGTLRHFAHTILHIWCPPKAHGLGCKTLIVSKNKNGPTGDVVAGWQARTVTFCDPKPDDERTYSQHVGGAV